MDIPNMDALILNGTSVLSGSEGSRVATVSLTETQYDEGIAVLQSCVDNLTGANSDATKTARTAEITRLNNLIP